MFTGLIQRIGRIEAASFGLRQPLLRIAHQPWECPLELGESVSVQGICLTMTRSEPGFFECNMLQETIRRTNLGAKRQGDRVNLERALRAGDRLGGHIVSGHIDGTGRVETIAPIGGDWRLTIACGPELIDGIVEKGSIAIDGVSLTVANVRPGSFTCHLVAFTLSNTTLDSLRAGSTVNLELDMLGKYARRRDAAAVPSGTGGITEETIVRAGRFGRT